MSNGRIVLLMLVASIISYQNHAVASECWEMESHADLELQKASAVALKLPIGSRGAYMTTENSDYRWEGASGTIWIKFANNASDWGAKKIGVAKIGLDDVALYRWRDGSGHDRLLGEWRPGSSINRRAIVSIPVDWENCESVSTARAIIDSVRFINNPDLIKVESPRLISGKWEITLIDELGDRRNLIVGDIATWDNGVVSDIDSNGMTVRSYDWETLSWKKSRFLIAK